LVDAPNASGGSKTLVKGIVLLNLVMGRPDGMTLTDISREADLPNPTAHRVLGVLLDQGLLRVDTAGVYRLGPQCLVLGTAFVEGLDIRAESRDLLAALVAHTGETCHLGVLDGHRIVYIEKTESSHAVRMHSRIGSTNLVHSTGLGKAMLAHCDDATVESVIAQGLAARTAHTITDPDRFRTEMGRVRRRGFAVDDVENEEGIRCVAAPVLDHKREVVAGISIAGPTYRLTVDRVSEVGQRVVATALELSQRIGYPGEIPVDPSAIEEGKR
jgi:IclR family acetate operon transcriptional repressor